MATPRRRELVTTLRQRLFRALQLRVLAPGDRLPGTRELAEEFDADPRVVADAYRELAAEGLVELRPRSGAFVHAGIPTPQRGAQPSAAWLADLFLAGIVRGVPAVDLPTTLRRALGRPPLPVAVIATTIDQTTGICRELSELIGLDSQGVLAQALLQVPAGRSPAAYRAALPRAVRRARLLVTTEAHAKPVAEVAAMLKRRSVAITIRPDLYETEWALLRGQEAYVLVADPRFGQLVADYMRDLGAQTRVRIVVAGRDDVSVIPDDAPTYATQAARERLGPLRLPAGVLPSARILSDDCLREVLREVLQVVRQGETSA